jgi:solute carrier family 25 phosphate transporter 23/24/25/41
MDVVRTRMLVAGGMVKYGSVGKCFASIMTKEGLSGFYRGFLPALFALTPNGAVYYTMYDHLKSNRLRTLEKEAAERAERAAAAAGKAGKRGNGAKGAVIEMEAPHAIRVEQGYMMLFGAVAGCAAEFSTYPFEVIRRRMQMQMGTSSVSSAVGMKALRRMTKTLRVILNSRGIPGLYAGCVPGIAQVLPSAALGYYSYEMFKIVLDVD